MRDGDLKLIDGGHQVLCKACKGKCKFTHAMVTILACGRRYVAASGNDPVTMCALIFAVPIAAAAAVFSCP